MRIFASSVVLSTPSAPALDTCSTMKVPARLWPATVRLVVTVTRRKRPAGRSMPRSVSTAAAGIVLSSSVTVVAPSPNGTLDSSRVAVICAAIPVGVTRKAPLGTVRRRPTSSTALALPLSSPRNRDAFVMSTFRVRVVPVVTCSNQKVPARVWPATVRRRFSPPIRRPTGRSVAMVMLWPATVMVTGSAGVMAPVLTSSRRVPLRLTWGTDTTTVPLSRPTTTPDFSTKAPLAFSMRTSSVVPSPRASRTPVNAMTVVAVPPRRTAPGRCCR